MKRKNRSENKHANIINKFIVLFISIIIIFILSSIIIAQDNNENNQNNNTNNQNESDDNTDNQNNNANSPNDGDDNQNEDSTDDQDNDTTRRQEGEDDEDGDTRRSEQGELIGYSKITIDENGKVILTEEVYESTLLETPGIPIYTYIYTDETDEETTDDNSSDAELESEKPIQIKAYKVNMSRNAYILDYVINVDSNTVIEERGVFKYINGKRYIDFLEFYVDGRLERIEYYDENGRLIAIERFDETGTYTRYLGKEEVDYIDPYGYYKTYTYNDDGELKRFAYYYPNGELLFTESLLETNQNKMRIIYDEQTRERIVKYLNNDNQVIKEEFYNEEDIIVFYREYLYDSDGELEKITIYEDVEIVRDHELVEVEQRVVFYFDGEDNLLKRERYLDNELISTTNYNSPSGQDDDSVNVDE